MPRLLIVLCLVLAATAVKSYGQSYQELRAHIVAEEGYRRDPYLVLGQWHIGVGHLTSSRSRRLTDDEVEALFAADLRFACSAAYRLTPGFAAHPKAVRIILVALCMNLGETGYGGFIVFRQAIDSHDYLAAARALDDSLWSRQLPARSARYQMTLIAASLD